MSSVMCEFGGKLVCFVIVKPFAFNYYLDMSYLGQKSKSNDKGKADSFIWTDDEVELLLKVTLEYKKCRGHEEC